MQPSTAVDGARAILEVLRAWGVRHVFTCPGTTETAFLDASLDYPEVAVLLTTHESVAVAMADGYARVTRRPAVAYLHTNVGLNNGLAHLAAAQVARSPVVILNGLKATTIQNRNGFTTSPSIRDFARQYVKWDWQTLRADALGEDFNRALKIATTAPQGPTFLGLSQDLLEAVGEVPIPPVARYQVGGRTRPDPDLVAHAARLLRGAARPLLVAGGEVTRAGAIDLVVALAEVLDAPVVLDDRRTIESRAFPTDHLHYAGLYAPSLEAVRDADVILLAGTRTFIEFEPPTESAVPPDATIIHLCGDPAEIGKTFPADVALVGDAALGLSDLLTALGTVPLPRTLRVNRQDRRRRAHEAYIAGQERARAAAAQLGDQMPVRVPALLHTLAGFLAPHTTVVADGVTASAGILTHLLPQTGRAFHTTASGSLGWGMGAALGIKLAAPDDEVLAVVGDGVFQFGIQALWTAVHAAIPVIWIVINNQSYAAVKSALHRYGRTAATRGEYPASAIPGPDIAAIARGFGAFGQRVECLADLAPALAAARVHAGPAVIEVMTDPNDLGPRPT